MTGEPTLQKAQMLQKFFVFLCTMHLGFLVLAFIWLLMFGSHILHIIGFFANLFGIFLSFNWYQYSLALEEWFRRNEQED